MKRVVQLLTHITVLLDKTVDEYCVRLRLSRSSFVYKAIIFYLESKGYKEVERIIKIDAQKDIIRQENYYFYMLKNAFMTVINMSKISLLLNGDVNYDKNERIIKNYLKLFRYYPPRIKKIMKEDMKSLKLLNNKKYLMQYMNNWDLIQEFVGVKQRQGAKRITIK